MGDYDLQIMVAVIFTGVIFSGFMFLYAEQPTIDFIPMTNESAGWDDPQTGVDIDNVFSLLNSFNEIDIFIIRLFSSALVIIGVVIVARFLRGV